MIFFLSVSIFMLFGAFFSKVKQDIFILVSFIIMFYILAYRGISVGTDTLNYEIAFNNLSSGADWVRSELEFGWVFLNDLIISLNGDFRDLLVVSAVLTLLPIFYVARSYSCNPMLTRPLAKVVIASSSVVFKKLCHFLKLLKTGMMHYGNYI